jgi:4-aminobutyrate aminotransferase / (S)-3-amino-2-methylpropionate transaminase / 5-aminovalerate transaminase
MKQTASRTADLLERRKRAVARGVATAHPLFVERADGARLRDVDGREYIDFAGGIGAMNLGHGHPAVVQAVRKQLDLFMHTSFQVAMYEGYVALAERMNDLAPGASQKKTVLFSTGAEATENAVKIARAATNRAAVVGFSYGYHGRTLLALSMTGRVAPYKQNFGPYAPEVYQAPYPDARRGYDTELALRELRELFETRVAARQIAAFIIEPVLGEGGFVPAPFTYLRELRKIASSHGIVLIVDEIQTGFGRTGTLFAIEQADVEPDLLTFGKSVAGGLPLSGVVGRAELMDAVEPGGLGGTYAGNPLACAAALATLEAFQSDDVLARATALAKIVRARLEKLATSYPNDIEDIRGLGPMQAIGFRDERDSNGKTLAQQVTAAALDFGLVALTAGPRTDVVRILVPLLADDDEITQGFDALERACERVLTA